MKARILSATIFSAILLTALVSCTNNNKIESKPSIKSSSYIDSASENKIPTENKTETPTLSQAYYNEIYSEIIDGFRNVIQNGMDDNTEIFGDPSILYEIEGHEADYNLGYAIEDLSDDGIPELIIASINEIRNDINYGDLVYAIYTYSDNELSLAFEGSYRNSYYYIGNSSFFYRGSGGAIYEIFGTFTLQRDGKNLKCNDYYFTYEKDESFEEIGYYHNTNGISDKEKSEEIDENEFWQKSLSMEKETVQIELTPFSDSYDVAEPSQLFADFMKNTNYKQADCDFYSVEKTGNETQILFTTDNTLQDFRLLSLFFNNIDDDGNLLYTIEDIYSHGVLTSLSPLIVEMTFYGDMPSYGVSYIDETGKRNYFSVSISGYDDSVELLRINEENIIQ
ncbi:MAG: hypothetical protein IKI94_08375 [Ruminococcus sp.]|nr:hypothetical protein [Ruminococcus sp.]